MNFRLFVLVDSDKCFKNHQSDKWKSLINHCSDLKITCHILYKREVENYLPHEALEKYAKKNGLKDLYDAYMKLTDDQKDFFDLKQGLPIKVASEIEKNITASQQDGKKTNKKNQSKSSSEKTEVEIEVAEQVKFFANLEKEDIKKLRGKGFGYSRELTNLFSNDDGTITRQTLSARCAGHKNPAGQTELEEILEKIVSLL